MQPFHVSRLLLLICVTLCTTISIEAQNDSRTGCNEMCGHVLIPYPFGIGRNCAANKWYTVDCNSSTPYLPALNNVEVLALNASHQTVTVNVSMISDCKDPLQKSNLNLTRTPFRFSRHDNIFAVMGCGNATIMDNGIIVTRCSTTCPKISCNGSCYGSILRPEYPNLGDTYTCFGIGCCQATIASDLESFTINLTGLAATQPGAGMCGASFLVDRNLFAEENYSRQFVPITLLWTEGFDYNSTECLSCKRSGGVCQPNPDVISGMTCLFYRSNKKSHDDDGVILGVSISMGLVLLMVISYILYKIGKKTKDTRQKQRYFKRNGGLLLKKQETSTSLVDKTILFTCNELEKATDHFNDNRILGRGDQGTVYKGMLADGRIVAIKKAKVIDESQLEQFINEVVILSQINHRNVVKLLGCCLETKVPMLVSEFISNGTLYDVIHDETGEFSYSLNMMLRIATEVAGAVSYLHSATSIPIYHRDIKTTNILLDENYRAKVSDFGTSRFVSIDQTHLTTVVKGTFGYLDPEYFQTSQFTDKSDVYSFGVVLLELLTREKPISLTRFGENRSLATYFMLAMEEGRVMSIFDAKLVEEGSRSVLLAIANLALQCLNSNGKSRPTMKEVVSELEGITLQCLNLNGKSRPTMKEVVSELEGITSSYVPSSIKTNIGDMKYWEEVSLTYDESRSTSFTFSDNPSH